MKRIFILLSTVAMTLALASCSKDYLNTKPSASTGTATIFETTKNAKLAVNGINKLMTRQLLGSQGFNGEGTIKMYYGNYPGNDFFVNMAGWSPIINGDLFEDKDSRYDYYPWYYYYMLIGNANPIIEYIDKAEGLQTERDFIKAQALTFRAYSFMMLSQLYCVRWSDSNNGAEKGLMLRVDNSTGDLARSTMSQTYAQIYSDLDQAIALFKSSGLKRSENYDVDINVAYATYARAALNKEDYAKAAEMATLAKTGYPLMNNEDYRAGFCNPTSEWIWSSYGGETETLYYYSYFAYIAYTSSASVVRNYPRCISKELFEKIPQTDIRKTMFADPTIKAGYQYDATTGQANKLMTADYKAKYPNMDPRSKIWAWMQFKIAANVNPGVGHLNHFRSSEMELIIAEANYFLGNYTEAQNALVRLNKGTGRDLSFVPSPDILNEIKFYRAIELWGEGFDWFDHKRWGDGISRKSLSDNGNFIEALAVSYGPHEKSNWTWVLPSKETDYNKLAKEFAAAQ